MCPLGIVSGSRDKTVKIWKEASDTEFVLDKTLVDTKSHGRNQGYTFVGGP